MDTSRIRETLRTALAGKPLSAEDAVALLSLEEPASIDQVMRAARIVRERHFGREVFLYGFIYLSTYCRNHCSFCFYRSGNPESPRYRKRPEEVAEIARGLVRSGVHLVDLTLGEDPLSYEEGDFSTLYVAVEAVKAATGVPIMVSPGVISASVLTRLAALGVDWYALYQETHNRELYRSLRLDQDFDARIRARSDAARAGMLVEDGMLLGVGESVHDRAASVTWMRRAGVDQARAMSFVPQVGTPLATRPSPPRWMEGLCLAVMRLAMPDRLIPASLDVDGIRGLRLRLDAGANVVTSIIPPRSRLAGVSQSSLDIEQGLRTVAEVRRVIEPLGLRTAAAGRYEEWMAARRRESRGREPGASRAPEEGENPLGAAMADPGSTAWRDATA